MNSTKFKGFSLLVVLALLLSTVAMVVPAAPVNAAVDTVTINTTGFPLFGHTGGMSPSVPFTVHTDADTNGDLRLEVLTHGTTNSVATNDITNVALPVTGDNIFTTYQINLTGVAAGTYDLRASALQPSGGGDRKYSAIASNALVIDNTIPAVTLTNPNGGNYISANDNYTVYFTVTDAIPNVTNVTVSGMYSVDGGTNYSYVAFTDTSVSKGATSAVWPATTMPGTDTNTARLQLTVTDAAGNQRVVNSASNFTIIKTLPTVAIHQPTSSSSWNGASTQVIQFTTITGLSVAQDYKIEFYNGTDWTTVKDWSASVTAVAGLVNYSWVVNNTYRGAAAQIMVTPKDKAGNIGSAEPSDTFTIVDITAPTVSVTAPLTGTKFYSGVTATGTNPLISWTSTDNVLSLGVTDQTLDYDIYLSTNGGTNYTLDSTISADDQPQGLNNITTWTPPAMLASSTACRIKVVPSDHATVPNINSTGAISPTFSILLPGTVTVTNLVPNGSQTWQVGTTQSITWTAADSSDSSARLNYLIKLSSDGATFPTTIANLTNQTPGAKTYSWPVSDNVSASCKIQITASNPASGVTGTPVASSGNFSITTASFPVETATVSLKEGWNLISLPLIPTNTDIRNILSTSIGSVNYVWQYNGGTSWYSFAPNLPTPINSLTTMVDGKGYWINMSADSSFTFQGRKGNPAPSIPPVYTTTTGWNLVGYKSTVNHTVGQYLGTNVANYNVPVTGFSNIGTAPGEQVFTVKYASDNMTPGNGYWVYYTSTGSIAPPPD